MNLRGVHAIALFLSLCGLACAGDDTADDVAAFMKALSRPAASYVNTISWHSELTFRASRSAGGCSLECESAGTMVLRYDSSGKLLLVFPVSGRRVVAPIGNCPCVRFGYTTNSGFQTDLLSREVCDEGFASIGLDAVAPRVTAWQVVQHQAGEILLGDTAVPAKQLELSWSEDGVERKLTATKPFRNGLMVYKLFVRTTDDSAEEPVSQPGDHPISFRSASDREPFWADVRAAVLASWGETDPHALIEKGFADAVAKYGAAAP